MRNLGTLSLAVGKKKRLITIRLASEDDWRSFAKQAQFDVRKLSSIFGISQRHTERLVRHKFNLSPRQFLLRERMLAARELLETAETIKEISFDLGYSHPSVFNRHFRRFYGKTPTEFLFNTLRPRHNSSSSAPEARL